ncbi:hypothetical protein DCC79_03455 [bacterium]|nr:MAG: hypothetical protein DCC79_03455 [bacterium]
MKTRPIPVHAAILLAAVLSPLLGAGGSGAAPAAPPPATAPVASVLVGLDGPSVVAELQAAGQPVAPGRRVRTADGEDLDVGGRGAAARDAIRAAEARVRARQAPVVDAARRLGATVVSRYTTAANGLLVHATADQVAALRSVPGVAFVEPAPIVRPNLRLSVPHVGAARLAADLGYDGTGSFVAIVDTGVDYTHKLLGGPGTVAAWQAASQPGATEVITDTFQGQPLFPTAKVVGGYDFVGPRYNPPHVCTPAQHAAGQCTNIPEPDDDPLDGAGHGTHVAGIVAGSGMPDIGDGMAPGARLVGLKLYGTGGADEAADVLVDAIEWCARVNLGIETRGVVPPRVDAVNISLGENWAQGSRLFDAAVAAATDAGVVVVASAGNAGNVPFIVGAPSASPRLVSVASSLPPTEVLEVTFRWEGGETVQPAVESSIARPLAEAGRIEDDLAWFGRGCNGDVPVQEVNEKVALVARGDCVFGEKLLNAQAAGAIAVVMYTNNQPKNAMGGGAEGITIPAVMIDNAPGLDLTQRLEGGQAVRVVIDAAGKRLDATNADGISGFSSRGPSKNGALKPDITAPGSNIMSAAMGSGDRGVSLGGTSMASPHVAGAAALVHHRNRAEGLDLSALDVAALLMNYARPVVFDTAGARPMVPVVRQGAGVIDLWRSGTADLVVRAGDIASLNLGPLYAVGPLRVERRLAARNVGDAPLTVRVAARFAYDEDAGAGLAVETPPEPVAVPPGTTVEIPLTFTVDPAALRPWALRPGATADGGAVQRLEIDGYVTLTPVDAAGEPVPEGPVASVPFYALPRAASELAAGYLPPALADRVNTLTWRNRSAHAGQVELFAAPLVAAPGGLARAAARGAADGLQAPAGAPEDPDEPDVARELDIRAVGARFEPPAAEGQPGRLTFGLVRHAPAAIPMVTSYAVYLDLDGDGRADHRVREAAAGSTMRTAFAAWDADAGAIRGTEAFTGTTHATDVHTRVTLLGVPLAAVGMTEPRAFGFWVVNTGLNEDWLFTPNVDVAPDGAGTPDGPRYGFDPTRLARVPLARSVPVPGGGEAVIGLNVGPGEDDAAWLALYPDDPGDTAQMQWIVPGDRSSTGWRLHFPDVRWDP